jgi:hypothetical protein
MEIEGSKQIDDKCKSSVGHITGACGLGRPHYGQSLYNRIMQTFAMS